MWEANNMKTEQWVVRLMNGKEVHSEEKRDTLEQAMEVYQSLKLANKFAGTGGSYVTFPRQEI
jgi:hypothetical protein